MGTPEYDRLNTRRVAMKLNVRTDADILLRLDTVPNKQAYVKSLIRQDLSQSAKTKKEAPGGRESSPSTAPGSR